MYLRVHLQLNEVLLELHLLLPDLLHLSRIALNQVLGVYLFPLDLFLVTALFHLLILLILILIVRRGSLGLLSEHKCLELNVKHLNRP